MLDPATPTTCRLQPAGSDLAACVTQSRVDRRHVTPRPPRVGLALGAGGVVGTAWLIGALVALCDETGWSSRDADVILGTSAGSVIGSLYAEGIAPQVMADIATRSPVADSDTLGSRNRVRVRAWGHNSHSHSPLRPSAPVPGGSGSRHCCIHAPIRVRRWSADGCRGAFSAPTLYVASSTAS